LKRKTELPSTIATKTPGEFDLGSLESRVAARTLAERRKDSRMRIKIRCIGQRRPANEPTPKNRNGLIETYYIDDDDYPDQGMS